MVTQEEEIYTHKNKKIIKKKHKGSRNLRLPDGILEVGI
jgi:hypothetical protein